MNLKLWTSIAISLALPFLLNCCSSKSTIAHDEQIADQIISQTGKQLYDEKHLRLIGTGGRMMYDIKVLHMGFQYFHEVDIDTARQLLVYSVERFLENINANEEIRPYLQNYPFTPDNVEIVIFFRKPDGHDVARDKPQIAGAKQGKVYYRTDVNPPPRRPLRDLHKETYEEAFQIVHGKARKDAMADQTLNTDE